MIPVPLLVSGSPNRLAFTYAALGALTFDPDITTSVPTIIKFKPDDAPETVLGPSTAHVYSYTPTVGTHKCVVTVIGGLGRVTVIESNSDGLLSVAGLRGCVNLAVVDFNNNGDLVLDLSAVSYAKTYLGLANCFNVTGNLSSISRARGDVSLANCSFVRGDLVSLSGVVGSLNLASCSLITGNLSSLSNVAGTLSLYSCVLITGDISSLSGVTGLLTLQSCSLITGDLSSLTGSKYWLDLVDCPLITGDLSDVSGVTYQLALGSCPLITGDLLDVANVTYWLNLMNCPLITGSAVPKIEYCYLNGQAADQARVDAILDYMYQAVLGNPNYYLAAAPYLAIAGNNATPSGVYQVATPPTTGLEKAYYLCHLAAHAWSIAWNGGSGP